MARHRNRQRDASVPSLGESLLSDAVSPLETIDPLEDVASLSDVEDARRFNPEGDLRSPSTLFGTLSPVHPVGESPLNQSRVMAMMERPELFNRRMPGRFASGLSFDKPREAVECARRKTRREVLFADPRKRRKGSGAKRRRDDYSNIKC